MLLPLVLGQANVSGIRILESAIQLSRDTARSWNGVWDTIFDSGVWFGLVSLGVTVAVLSVLYLAFAEGKKAVDEGDWASVVEMMVFPIVIVVFLANNGALLANTVQIMRNVAYHETNQIMNLQLSSYSLDTAIRTIATTQAARSQLEALYKPCQGEVDEQLVACWESKKDEALAIVTEAEGQAGTSLPELESFILEVADFGTVVRAGNVVEVGSLPFSPGQLFRAAFFPHVITLLMSLQWVVVNGLEIALLFSALFSPIAMGASLLPLGGRPLIAWLLGFIAIFGIQLGYSVMVGIVSIVMVDSGGALVSDVTFALFVSIFAPALSAAFATGSARAVYQAVNASFGVVRNTVSNILFAVARTAARVI